MFMRWRKRRRVQFYRPQKIYRTITNHIIEKTRLIRAEKMRSVLIAILSGELIAVDEKLPIWVLQMVFNNNNNNNNNDNNGYY